MYLAIQNQQYCRLLAIEIIFCTRAVLVICFVTNQYSIIQTHSRFQKQSSKATPHCCTVRTNLRSDPTHSDSHRHPQVLREPDFLGADIQYGYTIFCNKITSIATQFVEMAPTNLAVQEKSTTGPLDNSRLSKMDRRL